MDGSRRYDLEELSKMLKGNPTRQARREIEETIYKIAHTSAPINSLRERLIKATRGGDVIEIRKIQAHIHAIRQQETNGKEF
jgi:hypothetical protein